MHPLLSFGPFSPKDNEAPVSAPRLRDRKIRTHALHFSIAPEPFFVLYLPVPNGRCPLILCPGALFLPFSYNLG